MLDFLIYLSFIISYYKMYQDKSSNYTLWKQLIERDLKFIVNLWALRYLKE